jgi:hypothetical protein
VTTPAARLLHALNRVESLVADGEVPAHFALTQVARLTGVDGVDLALAWEQKRRACAEAKAKVAKMRPEEDDAS